MIPCAVYVVYWVSRYGPYHNEVKANFKMFVEEKDANKLVLKLKKDKERDVWVDVRHEWIPEI